MYFPLEYNTIVVLVFECNTATHNSINMLLREYSIRGISETSLDDSSDSNKLIVEEYQKAIGRDHTGHFCGLMVYIANGIPTQCKKRS